MRSYCRSFGWKRLQRTWHSDEKYRLPFVLKYYNHFTEDEIAATLDLPKGAVAVRIFRAKKKIQDYIRQKEGE